MSKNVNVFVSVKNIYFLEGVRVGLCPKKSIPIHFQHFSIILINFMVNLYFEKILIRTLFWEGRGENVCVLYTCENFYILSWLLSLNWMTLKIMFNYLIIIRATTSDLKWLTWQPCERTVNIPQVMTTTGYRTIIMATEWQKKII